MKTEILLYGLRATNTERYQEELLTVATTVERVRQVTELAKSQGFHSFRVATYNGQAPDFAVTVSI